MPRVYDFQPLLGSQIRRNQMTYSTPNRLEFAMARSLADVSGAAPV